MYHKMSQKLFFIIAFCVALIAIDVSRLRVPLEAKDTLPVRLFMYQRRLREIKVCTCIRISQRFT